MRRRERNEVTAANLRALRARKNVSQSVVAEAIGVNASTLGIWEQGGGISFEAAQKLADYYGVSLGELAGRTYCEPASA